MRGDFTDTRGKEMQHVHALTLEEVSSLLQYNDLANAFSSLSEKALAGRILKRVSTQFYTLLDVQRDIDDYFTLKIGELLEATKDETAKKNLTLILNLSELVNIVTILHNLSIGRKPAIIYPSVLVKKILPPTGEEIDLTALKESVSKPFGRLIDQYVINKKIEASEIRRALNKSVEGVDKISNYRVWKAIGLYHDIIALRLCRMFPELIGEHVSLLILEDKAFKDACNTDLRELSKTASGYRRVVMEFFEALNDALSFLGGVEAVDVALILTMMSISKTLTGSVEESSVKKLIHLMANSMILKLIALSIYTGSYKVELQRLMNKWLK